jgi:hypothetical protein
MVRTNMKTYDSSYRVKCPFCARLDKCYDPVGHDHTCALCHMTFDVAKLEFATTSPNPRIVVPTVA